MSVSMIKTEKKIKKERKLQEGMIRHSCFPLQLLLKVKHGVDEVEMSVSLS